MQPAKPATPLKGPGPSDFGAALRSRRTRRRYSQLELAAAAEVSQRHLSFLETGRARPSREMVLHLAGVLDLALRERNELLLAAGFAPLYPETGLERPEMDRVRQMFHFILESHEPYPGIVVDRRWDVVMINEAAARLIRLLIEPDAAASAAGLGSNLARLSFHPDGLRRVTANWPEVGAMLLERLQREVSHRPEDVALERILDEVLEYPGVAQLARSSREPVAGDPLLHAHFVTDDLDVRLISTMSTIAAPFDVTLEELRLETFYAADPGTDSILRRLGEDAA